MKISICMTYTHPQTYPRDPLTLSRHHPETPRHHPDTSGIGVFGHWMALEEKAMHNITTLIQLFSIYTTSIHPRHLPDTLRPHPDTPRHYLDTPRYRRFCALEGTGRKSNSLILRHLFNCFQSIWHLHTAPDISQRPIDPIQTPSRDPQTLSRHPQI